MTVEQYRKELEKNASRFLKALDQYEVARDVKEKTHFRAVMDESLKLMHAAAQEITGDGLRKQEGGVEKLYKAYIENETKDNLLILREELHYLRDNNKR